MKLTIALSAAAIVAAIVFGPFATEWIAQPTETERVICETLGPDYCD